MINLLWCCLCTISQNYLLKMSRDTKQVDKFQKSSIQLENYIAWTFEKKQFILLEDDENSNDIRMKRFKSRMLKLLRMATSFNSNMSIWFWYWLFFFLSLKPSNCTHKPIFHSKRKEKSNHQSHILSRVTHTFSITCAFNHLYDISSSHKHNKIKQRKERRTKFIQSSHTSTHLHTLCEEH